MNALVLLLVAAAPAVTTRTQLDGLDVVVVDTPRARCSARLVVRAGGIDDPTGKAGLAHLVEHLTFGGASGRDALFRSRSDINAATMADGTVFSVETDAASCADELGAMLSVVTEGRFKLGWFAPELEVVRREAIYSTSRRSTLEQVLFGWSAERLIGTSASRELLKNSDVVTFFQANYTTSNMALLVVGHVDPARIEEVVRHSLRIGPALPNEWKQRELPAVEFDTGERAVSTLSPTGVYLSTSLSSSEVASCRYGAALLRLRLRQSLERGVDVDVDCIATRGRLVLFVELDTAKANRQRVREVAVKLWRTLSPPTGAEQALLKQRFEAEAAIRSSLLVDYLVGSAFWLRGDALFAAVREWTQVPAYDKSQLDALRLRMTPQNSLVMTGRVTD